ncbi:hypothetical protein, partial [Sphaerotilus sp.]|uniref:hypothetical protein n=1 Tax=Sphaerotilus sp. TaxID=2093942 RepID=UPI0034E29C1D
GELYLSHLRRSTTGPAEATTVFCPGDPLEVCPDFFALLEASALWGEVQPLSQARTEGEFARDPRDWVADLPIAPVRFDLCSWAPLGGFDKVVYRTQHRYRQTHRLTDDDHPAVHFFEACGLGRFARTVGQHDLGLRDSGLLFAVRQSRINDWLAADGPALAQAGDWLRQDPVHVRIWDQFWLHLFGMPFTRMDTLSCPDPALDIGNDEDALLEDFSLSRALATIDDTLARLAPPPLAHRDHRPSALQVARAIAATQARPAPARSAESRRDLADLSERAAQAFRMGDLQYAVSCAQLALKQDANHTASRFTLAMALSAQGSREAALEQFELLLNVEAPAARRIPVPDRTTAPTRPQ